MPNPPPRIDYTEDLVLLLDEANTELHRLNGVAYLAPDASLLADAAVRLSAVALAALDGETTDALDVLRLEAGHADGFDPGRKAAAQRALDRAAALRASLALVAGGAALDPRVLAAVDGQGCGTAIVHLHRLLDDRSFPLLVRVALAQHALAQHALAEPGRGGRGGRGGHQQHLGPLLLPLALAAERMLVAPLLRMPAFLAAHPDDFRSLLGSPDHGPWVRFFLEGVRTQARDDGRWALQARQLHLAAHDRLRGARASPTAVAAAAQLVARPYLSAATLAADLAVSRPTARAAIERLVGHGDLVETTNKKRDRYYVAPTLLAGVYGTEWSLGGDSNP